MPIIDFHTHAFPDSLAPKAMKVLSETAETHPLTDGTIQGLLSRMNEWNISRAVVCNIATTPHQTESVNRFADQTNEVYGDKITALYSVHPLSPDLGTYLEQAVFKKIPGIKIHPDYIGLDFSDKSLDPILEFCAGHDLFVVTHAGLDPVSPGHVHCTPKMIRDRLLQFPSLKLLAAHFGSYRMNHEFLQELAGSNVFIDTSLAPDIPIEKNEARKILHSLDSERILFGSDCPWSDAQKNLRYLESLSLSSDLMEKILYRNAVQLLSHS